MASPGEKSFCVLEYHTSKSVVTVPRDLAGVKARIIAAVKNIDAPS